MYLLAVHISDAKTKEALYPKLDATNKNVYQISQISKITPEKAKLKIITDSF